MTPAKRLLRFSLSNIMVARTVDGAVVLHVPTNTYLRLDSTATEILELIGSMGEQGAVIAMADRHGLDPEVASADVASVTNAIKSARSPRLLSERRPVLRTGARVVRDWLHLTVPIKVAVAQITAVVIAVEIALRLLPIDTVARWIGAPLAATHGAGAPIAPELDPAELSGRDLLGLKAVEWTLARWFFDATCLRRALARGWILRRLRPHLHIGLIDERDVLAHAWLEFDGSALGSLPGIVDFTRWVEQTHE